MVKVETHIFGIYPKTEELRIKINRWERGRLQTSEISETISKEKETYYKLVKDAGITTFTDPLFNWYDILRPIVLLSGGKLGPLTRYKENNTFYRLPEFDAVSGLALDPTKSGEIEANPPLPLYQGTDEEGFSAFLPSPVTLYRMSQVSEKVSKAKFVSAIIDNYLEICKKFGIRRISLFESFEYGDEDISFLDRLSDELDVYLITEGEIRDEQFSKLNGKLYSIIVSDTSNFSVALKHSKVPGIKLIDARNTKLETVDSVKSQIASVAGGAEKVVVTVTDYLDFLPRSIADKKVEILSKVGE